MAKDIETLAELGESVIIRKVFEAEDEIKKVMEFGMGAEETNLEMKIAISKYVTIIRHYEKVYKIKVGLGKEQIKTQLEMKGYNPKEMGL